LSIIGDILGPTVSDSEILLDQALVGSDGIE